MINQNLGNRAVKQRTGAVLPLTVILLVVLVGMVAFAVDLGYLGLARTEIQAAADAGALGGALALGTDGFDDARYLAQTAVNANNVAGSPLVFRADDVELGTWDSDTRQFTKLSGEDESEANSVRVTCHRTSLRGNPIPLFFAPVLGVDFGEASASAIALRAPMCGALIGLDSADLNGSGAYIDSYNSREGTYESQSPGNKGHLCSNGDVNVQSGFINGNAIPGPGHEVRIGSGGVSGSTTPRKKRLLVPAVDFGNVMTNNDNENLPKPPYVPAQKRFKHNDGALVMPSGTYFFTDFSLNGGPVIVDGPVTIYVDGNVSVSGSGVLNISNSPENLQIFATGKSVKISGSAGFAGVVYAPSSDIVVGGGGAFFGAAVGKSLKLHNSGGVHVDESVLGPLPARSRLVD